MVDATTGGPDPPRGILHVGAPKTGTTYLQAVLWRNREALSAAGVRYPLQRPFEHFYAALDVREMSWGGRADGPWLGSWDQLATRVDAWEGSVVLSNELLGGVTAAQARRVVDDLAGAVGREIHVVFTARDIARQLPSDWQEHVKHRHPVTLQRFADDLVRLGRDAPAPFGEMFWGLHDAAAVLGAWAAVVPTDQLHLVTVSQRHAGPYELWGRFAEAAGLTGLALDLDVEPRNVSLGVVEAELLRRLNVHLQGRFPHWHYDDLVRSVLAETVLVSAGRLVPPSERPTLAPEHQEWAVQRSRQLIAAVAAAGYDVVGDLQELLPVVPPEGESPGRRPEDLSTGDLLPVALDAVTGLLGQLADVADHGRNERELRKKVHELERELRATVHKFEAELDEARSERDYWRDGGVAHRLVRFTDQHRWMMPARRAYIGTRDRLRGTSSRQQPGDG